LRCSGSRREPQLLPQAVFITYAIFLVRLPGILDSYWNPHVAILPFLSFLLVAAATMSGDLVLLPWTAAIGSFLVQTHVAYAPLVLAVLASAYGVATYTLWRQRGEVRRRQLTRWTVIAIGTLQVLWLLPLSEEVVMSPGNMTLIARFFFLRSVSQPVVYAWRVWSGELLSIFFRSLSLPVGWQVATVSGIVPLILAPIIVVSVLVAAIWSFRNGYYLSASIATLCFIASWVGLWAIWRIQGAVADYQVFWLSILGTLNISLSTTTLAFRLWPRRGRPPGYAVIFGTLVLITGAAWTGVTQMNVARQGSMLSTESLAVQNVTDQLLAGRAPAERPLIRFGPYMWDVAPGLLVQMGRHSILFGLDARATRIFGPGFSTSGDETTLWTVCHRDVHLQLLARRHNQVLAQDDAADVYVDSVSLIESPEYRFAY
jgi:hypothetical protein